MKIKKIGHCCLVLEVNGKRIMTDPGSYTLEEHSKEENIDLILITHEHGDHLHVESLKQVVVNNPNAKIITNNSVGVIIGEAGIKYEVLEDRVAIEVSGIQLEAYECKHEEIFKDIGQVQNTAYFIDGRLFFPGDSYYNPGKPVEILALPVAGPWSKVKDAVNYALNVKPKKCFPMHDGGLKSVDGGNHKIHAIVLPQNGIEFVSLNAGEEKNL